MSRRVGAALALCLVVSPASADVDARNSAVVEEAGAASWMFPTGRPGRSTWYFGGAYRTAAAGGRTVTTGFVVEGTCRETRRDGATVTACRGTGTGGRIPAGAFTVDPTLRRGSLVVRDGGHRHDISWRADEAPPAGYVQGETCENGTGEGGGFLQHATATGTLFGRRLAARGVDHAILTRGAMVTECTAELVRRAAAGDPVRIVFR